jgi:hypothetical protein
VFKKDIAPMEKGSEAILALRPVTFHYKTDSKGAPQFGLIAEEVAEVNPDLLLKQFLKEHKKVEALESTVATLAATLKEQALEIQKVSAQLEVSKPRREPF